MAADLERVAFRPLAVRVVDDPHRQPEHPPLDRGEDVELDRASRSRWASIALREPALTPLSSTDAVETHAEAGPLRERHPPVVCARLVGERDPEDLILVGRRRGRRAAACTRAGASRGSRPRGARCARNRGAGTTSRPNVSPSAQTRRASVIPPSLFTSGCSTSTAPAGDEVAEAVPRRLVLARGDWASRRRHGCARARATSSGIDGLLDPAQPDARRPRSPGCSESRSRRPSSCRRRPSRRRRGRPRPRPFAPARRSARSPRGRRAARTGAAA